MKKKILIISRAFYPSNTPRSFRTTELAKQFSKMGNEVTVITPSKKEHEVFSKDYNIQFKELKLNPYKQISFKSDIKVLKIFERILNRLLQLLFEYPDIEIFVKAKKNFNVSKKFDLLISVAYPHPIHWGVSRIWKKSSETNIADLWIADCGDPYMGSTIDNFKKLFYFKFVEKWWCKKVDFITVPFDGAKEGYYSEFHDKIKIIPQGFNFEESKSYLSKYKVNEVITFAYAGSFSPNKRDPREFIKFLLKTKIKFKFIIFTKDKFLLNNYLKLAKDQIVIKDYIDRPHLLSFLSKMDFILNINNSVSTQLPSKLIDYAIIDRPILSIDSFNFNKDIVNEFLNRNYENGYKVSNISQYKIENVCKSFLELTHKKGLNV